MHEKKIVFITEDIFGDSVGGVEQHIFNISKELSLSGFDITIIALQASNQDKRIEKVINIDACSIKLINIKKKNLFYDLIKKLESKFTGNLGFLAALLGKLLPNIHFKTLIKEVKKLKPDIVHQHDYLANIIASKKLSKIYPIVFTNHTGQYLFLEKTIIGRMIQKQLISHYKTIIGPSRELTPNNNNSIFIPNGVDTNLFNGERYIKYSNKIVFICPRRWAPTKGIKFLAEAIVALPENIRDKCIFLFAGSDSNDYPKYAEEVEKILQSTSSDCCKLLGNLNQNQLKDAFLHSDVVIIPSLMEATSLAAMEGMSCGLPVLSTNVGGMPDVVINKDLGWLVEPKNPIPIKDVIIDIANKKYNLEKMGSLSKAFVNQNRSWEEIAKRVKNIYVDILIREEVIK